MTTKVRLALLLGIAAGVGALAPVPALAEAGRSLALGGQPTSYGVELVSTAAFGIDMNDAGIVTGTSYPDPGCGSSCLPPLETVVWNGGKRIVLPVPAGLSDMRVSGINAQGWVAGSAALANGRRHAVVWKRMGGGYAATDLGTLPGTSISDAIGIDDVGRVVGWSTTADFPPNGSPFVWTAAGGMVDLSSQGFPDEQPLALSPGGTVATPGFWFRLGDVASVAPMPAPPTGFYPPGTDPTAINDAGDQARFLSSTGAENLRYLFRFHHEGTWQQISSQGTGHLAPYGVGSITAAGDVTATVVGAGIVAYGPDGVAQPLAPLVSDAYGGGDVTFGGPMNASGEILAQLIVGQSKRLVRLVPAEPCTTSCVRVVDLQLAAEGPSRCDQGGTRATAMPTVTDEQGNPVQGARIVGHFMDDYWLNREVTGTTDANGHAMFKHKGPPCIGAISFLVTDAVSAGLTFDRTAGTLTSWVIPA